MTTLEQLALFAGASAWMSARQMGAPEAVCAYAAATGTAVAIMAVVVRLHQAGGL